MKISKNCKKIWLNKSYEFFAVNDNNYSERLDASWPVFGIKWAVIVLNEFDNNIWNKRLVAKNYNLLNRELILDKQLQKSRKICNKIKAEVSF
jgi:hypothetical protein